MKKTTRSLLVLAAVVCLAGSMSFAESGEAIYKAKCQSCHGAQGTPNPGIAKVMGVKPFSDPEVKKLTAAEMAKATTDGKGKMPSFKGKLTDEQIKDVVAYLRTLK
ncbi:MAG TPA: cytochrome c [Terracidiphilus sp.]|nr:cytochrome c [Terracidiphilus sp.]